MKFITTILLIVIVDATLKIEAKPYRHERYSLDEDDGGNNFSCYHIQCPKGAVACKRLQTTNKDGSKLITEIECQDENGSTLNTVKKEEANPFDRATKFTSYSFTGHYEGSIGRPTTRFNNVNNLSRFGNNFDSDVEIF